MKKFVFLTIGFEKPTPEIMEAWGQWLGSIKENIVEMGHMANGREISDAGTAELSMDLSAITGFMIVTAESIEAAEQLAAGNPYITSIRVYELMSG